MNIPKGCAKCLEDGSSAIAWHVRNFLSDDECQSLIEKAQQTESGFYYVKEAKHVADDGTEYTVELMKPNTHKLSLILGDTTAVTMIWTRIRNILFREELLSKSFVQRYGMPLGLNPRLR